MKFRILLLAMLFALCGCLSRTRTIPQNERPLPAQTVDRAKLFQELQRRSEEVKTLNATVALDISSGSNRTGVLTEYRQTKGFILVERPNQIRIRAQAPLALATVFDMVSDGNQYRVSVPFRNQFFIGDTNAPPRAGNPVLNLRPQHILDALFVDTLMHLKNPDVRPVLEEATGGRNSYYVVQFIRIAGADADLVEKLWIDRSNMQIVRKQRFGRDGRVEADVEYTGHQIMGGGVFPQTILIKHPVEDWNLKITFQRTALNEQLTGDAFRLERPAGSELVQLEPLVRLLQ